MDVDHEHAGSVAGGYVLGLAIGETSVRAAIVRRGRDGDTAGGPRSLPLGEELLPEPELCSARRAMARVGTPTPLYLGDRAVPAAGLVARLVAAAVADVTAREGAAPAHTVLTVAPSWGEHRRAVLAAALAEAGVPAVSLASGAVAVARHHHDAPGLAAGAAVAVFDLGAGTLDTAVVRIGDRHAGEHLAVPPSPLPWGGADVDDALLAQLCHALDVDDPAGEDGLAEELRRQCVAVKEALSTDTAVVVDIRRPGGTTSLRLVREDLQELLVGPIGTSIDALRATVAGAGLAVEDLAAVLLAGGGVRIPLVAESLSAELGRPVIVGPDPAATAALGAAALAADLGLAGDEPATGDEPDTGAENGDDGGDVPDGLHRHPAHLPPGRSPRGRSRPAPRPDDSRPPRRALRRSLIVAGLFVTLLAVPAGLLATMNFSVLSDLGSHSVAAAGEPTTTTPPARQGTSPAAATQGGSGGGSEPAKADRAHQSTAGSSTAPSQQPSTGGAAVDALTAAGATAAGTTATSSSTGTSTPSGTTTTTPPGSTPPTTTPPSTTTTPPDTTPPTTTPPSDTTPPTTPTDTSTPPPTTEPPPQTSTPPSGTTEPAADTSAATTLTATADPPATVPTTASGAA